jgi:hypothetical protein
MDTAQNIALPQKWVQALNLESRLGHDVFIETKQGMPYAGVLRDALELGLSAVHCIKGIPSTAILDNRDQDRATLDRVHRALWNQGVADFLLVIRDDSLAIYSLWASPPEKGIETGKPDLRFLDSLLIAQRDEIADLLPRVESGTIFADYAPKLNPKDRVDSRLISDLAAYRKILVDMDKISQEDAHKALLQAMFLRYLWDRGIISEKHTQHYGGENYTTLPGLLRAPGDGWKKLLTFLSKAFNGNMLLPNDRVWELGGETLAKFLEGIFDPEEKRNRLFPLYQFNHIPVELISEVYDRFLESAGEQKKNGAYYTPRRLANLVVDQVWPAVQAILNSGITPKILDPTCGSGVFLVALLQRMACQLGDKGTPGHWAKLKHLATNLHGLDINQTAINIASFSIALALLNERQPREIESELVNSSSILPTLLGNSLRKQNFFELPETETFHIIIGNPPWGQQKDETVSPGVAWCRAQKYPKPPNGEMAWPFLWKSPKHLKTSGGLSLLLPMTACVHNAGAALDFLLNDVRLQCLVDLSDLRNILFPKAKVPACILSAILGKEIARYRYIHLCPKADLHASKAGRILLAPEDHHTVWVQHLLASPALVCQRLMWVSPVEERLLRHLESLPHLGRLLKTTRIARNESKGGRPEWGIGLGFQAYRADKEKGRKEKIKKLSELLTLPHLSSPDKLVLWAQPRIQTMGHAEGVVRRRFIESYSAPHIVMVPSTTEQAEYRLRATYSEQPFSFKMSLMGIVVPDSPSGRDTAKLLTAILNSTFTGWYIYYLTNMGADRERLSKRYDSFLSLPFPEPSDLPDPEEAQRVRSQIIRIMDALLEEANRDSRALSVQPDERAIRQRLDDLVFAYYGIKDDEVAIIQELFAHIRPAMHPNANDFPALWSNANFQEKEAYCATLGKVLSRRMRGGTTVQAQVIAKTHELALVHISRHPQDASIVQQYQATFKDKNADVTTLPLDLHAKMLVELRHNVYLERAIFFFFGDDAYLLKPLQRRFWLTRAALRDADRFVEYLLTPETNSDGPVQ